MKIISKKNNDIEDLKINLNGNNIHEDVEKELTFHYSKTNIYISIASLIIQGVCPILTVWLLTSPDFDFFPALNSGSAIGLSFSLIIFVCVFSIATFFLKLHNYDQIAYNIAAAGFMIGIYVSSYWWNLEHFFYRFLVAFGFLIIFIALGTIISILVKNFMFYLAEKK